jgi:hypothetical protein
MSNALQTDFTSFAIFVLASTASVHPAASLQSPVIAQRLANVDFGERITTFPDR